MTLGSKRFLFSLILILLSTMVLVPTALNLSNQVSAQTTQVTIWSANFDTGDNSQFNVPYGPTNPSERCLNPVLGVSSTIVYDSAKYAGYYYGEGQGANVTANGGGCKVAPSQLFTKAPYTQYLPINSFYWNMWVYIPSVSLVGKWISFATFGAVGYLPCCFTLDSNATQQINLYIGLLSFGEYNIIPENLVQPALTFPFNQWFSLSVTAYNVASSQANLTIFMNGTPITNYIGPLLPAPMNYVHFALYMSNDQPSLTVLNDDIIVQKFVTGTSSSTTSTSSQTTTVSSTSTSSTTFTSTSSTRTSSSSTTTSGLSSITVRVLESTPCFSTTITAQLVLNGVTIAQKQASLSCTATKFSYSFSGLAAGTYTVTVNWGSQSQSAQATVPPNQSVTFIIS